jgi:peptidoglycan hydrolase-like protein with peptidoglycan-binding domain
VDGVFGPETRTAIRRYQSSMGAEATGGLTGPQLAALLGSGR